MRDRDMGTPGGRAAALQRRQPKAVLSLRSVPFLRSDPERGADRVPALSATPCPTRKLDRTPPLFDRCPPVGSAPQAPAEFSPEPPCVRVQLVCHHRRSPPVEDFPRHACHHQTGHSEHLRVINHVDEVIGIPIDGEIEAPALGDGACQTSPPRSGKRLACSEGCRRFCSRRAICFVVAFWMFDSAVAHERSKRPDERIRIRLSGVRCASALLALSENDQGA